MPSGPPFSVICITLMDGWMGLCRRAGVLHSSPPPTPDSVLGSIYLGLSSLRVWGVRAGFLGGLIGLVRDGWPRALPRSPSDSVRGEKNGRLK
jgi:hypothetical protein